MAEPEQPPTPDKPPVPMREEGHTVPTRDNPGTPMAQQAQVPIARKEIALSAKGSVLPSKAIPTSGSPLIPKDITKDPSVLHYMAEFWCGTGSVKVDLMGPTDIQAALSALALALRYQPEVHTLGVWRREKYQSPNLVDTVCYISLHDLYGNCTELMNRLTGRELAAPGAVVIGSAEAGTDELTGKVKTQGGQRL